MSKKDRIAIVVSILFCIFPLAILFEGARKAPIQALFLMTPLIAYWGYRFIKNDISFLKSSVKDEI